VGKNRRKYKRNGKMRKKIKQLLSDLKEKKRYWSLKEEAHCGELALEEVTDLSRDRLRNQLIN
jgi:hypothetical protein